MEKRKVKIAWYGKHFGEEPPLVGENTSPSASRLASPCKGEGVLASSLPSSEKAGAGAIFFSGCNLKCVFCQNHQISQANIGQEYSVEELAQIMLDLQNQGAVNIDLVTPNVWRREVRAAIITARRAGLEIPIVWNSNAYEAVGALREMSELIDIYLPDFKYSDDEAALKYSRAPKYSQVAEAALREMLRQAGRLKIENGIAKKGVIVRHMILPGNLANTFSVLEKIAAIDNNVHLSLMSQYYPVYRAGEFAEISRAVSAEEAAAAEKKKFELGLENGWTQEPEAGEVFLPDFEKPNPFLL